MAALSGQKTVAAAGTAVALGTVQVNAPVMVKALTTNTDLVYVGNVDGAVSSSTGYPLAAGDELILSSVGDLASVMVDAAVNGEGVAWIVLEL